jgi:hypothetical protein
MVKVSSKHALAVGSIVAGAFAAILTLGAAGFAAGAVDETKFPAWTGYWMKTGAGGWDPSKPAFRGQEPPLTPEYRAMWEASMADQAAGGQGNNHMG